MNRTVISLLLFAGIFSGSVAVLAQTEQPSADPAARGPMGRAGMGRGGKDGTMAPGERMGERRGGRMGGAGMAGSESDMQQAMILRMLENPKFVEEIGLSAEQVQKLRDDVTATQQREEQLRKDLEAVSMEQANLMLKEAMDETAIMQLIDRKYDIIREMAKIRIRRLLTVKSTLTAEQMQKVRDLIRERMRQRMEGMQQGGGQPGASGQPSQPGQGGGRGNRPGPWKERAGGTTGETPKPQDVQ